MRSVEADVMNSSPPIDDRSGTNASDSIASASSRVAPSAGVVGVLGGMGPLATIDFMSKMMALTEASTDQDHVPVVVSSIPQVPDRTEAFRGEGISPVAAMVDSAQRLVAARAGLVVIACNTAHLWYDEIEGAIGLPMIHLVDAAIEDAAMLAGPEGRIGLLGTDATLASGLYVNRAAPASMPQGVHWLLPTAGEMIELVMPGIAAVKAGRLESAASLLLAAAQALMQRGATAIILGCTEIPVVLNKGNSPLPVIDATAALARRAVAWSISQRLPRTDAHHA
jgi:aspartate racemase